MIFIGFRGVESQFPANIPIAELSDARQNAKIEQVQMVAFDGRCTIYSIVNQIAHNYLHSLICFHNVLISPMCKSSHNIFIFLSYFMMIFLYGTGDTKGLAALPGRENDFRQCLELSIDTAKALSCARYAAYTVVISDNQLN